MITVTPLGELGRFSNDWLNARYHFSFAGYYDPARTGLGPLLVWNDDTIEPGRGFGHGCEMLFNILLEGQDLLFHLHAGQPHLLKPLSLFCRELLRRDLLLLPRRRLVVLARGRALVGRGRCGSVCAFTECSVVYVVRDGWPSAWPASPDQGASLEFAQRLQHRRAVWMNCAVMSLTNDKMNNGTQKGHPSKC